MFVGKSIPEDDWGRVNIPKWLVTKTGSFVAIAMDTKRIEYDGMISNIKELYPEVYFNSKIDNNDFIGPLGIAYAHRIMAGQVKLEVTARKV